MTTARSAGAAAVLVMVLLSAANWLVPSPVAVKWTVQAVLLITAGLVGTYVKRHGNSATRR